jgi:hypothetical protein
MQIREIRDSLKYYLKRLNYLKLSKLLLINLVTVLVLIGLGLYFISVDLSTDEPKLSIEIRKDLKDITAYRLQKQELISNNLSHIFASGSLKTEQSREKAKVAFIAFSQWMHLVVIQNQVRYSPEKAGEFHIEIAAYREAALFKITKDQSKNIQTLKEEKMHNAWVELKYFKFSSFWSNFDSALQMLALQGQTYVDKSLKSYVGRPNKQLTRVLQWQDHIIYLAKKYQLDPSLIAAIIEQESGGNPNALSPAGAVGLMQLMPDTARSLGVNPFDPLQNMEGGAKYIKGQLDRFGNIPDALVAYNAGPSRVGKPLFTETQGYVLKVPKLMKKYQAYFKTVEVVNLKNYLPEKN